MSGAWGGRANAGAGDGGVGGSVDAGAYVVDQLRRGRPFVELAVAFVIGVGLGLGWPRGWGWLVVAGVPLALMGVMLWRGRREGRAKAGRVRAALCWGLVAVVPLAAAWAGLRTEHVGEHHITRYLGAESRLAEVTGTVVSEPYVRTPKRGAFGEFSYMPPATVFRLSLDSIVDDGERVPTAGTVIARVDAAEHRLGEGERIRAKGWLAPLTGPRNPGEVDHRRRLIEQGVFARLTLRSGGNWSKLEGEDGGSWWQGLRAWRGGLAREARRVLRQGMLEASDEAGPRAQRRRLALLEALLLGQRRAEAAAIHESFRRVGLAHLMAISGAHLGILLGLVWLVVRLVTPWPSRAAAAVLIVLGLYLLIVPWRVPIVRAAVMAGLLCAAYGRGRGVSAMGMLALAAVGVLLWRPGDLASAGFQLSFGIVAALLMFTRPLADRLWPGGASETGEAAWPRRVARRGVEYVAVSVIAFMVALPVVAHHFEMVNPLAVLMSVLALPVVTALLALGYLKLWLGVVLPSASLLLAWPLARVTDGMLALVVHAGAWPGAAIELAQPPPVAWVVAMLGAVAALLWGCFARRRAALVACVVVLSGWTFLTQRPGGIESVMGAARAGEGSALRVNMFDVGHGSAFLVRTGDYTLMYDCGSQPYLDVGERRIVPALRRLGVRRIDALMISHGDLDHYAGVLAVVDALEVGAVRVPPQLLAQAEGAAGTAVAHLVDELRARGARLEPTERGWSKRVNDTHLEVLWPPADARPARANDTSLVLRVTQGGRRLLLSGDIEQAAIERLTRGGVGGPLRAEVAELPHHGGWVDSSPAWLEAVEPRVVLQSSARPRGSRDPWAPLLAERGVERLATHERGMVELVLRPGAPIQWRAFDGTRGEVRAGAGRSSLAR